MHFTIERDAVIDTVAHVARRAKRGSIPILEHILLTAEGQSVTLGGHDGQSSGSGVVAADVKEPGACVVPGEQFLSIVDRMPKGSHVTLKFDPAEALAHVASGRSKYRLSTLPVDTFPPLLAPVEPATLSLTADDIAAIFDGPKIVTRDDDPTKPAGIFFHGDDKGVLSGCATDFHTLVKVASDIKFPKGASNIVIPRRAIEEILKTTGDHGGEFSWSDKILTVKSGQWTYSTKLIDMAFPDYAKFLPKANGHFINVNTAELRSAIHRLQAIEATRSFVKLEWDAGATELSASLNGNGEGGEFIPCEAIEMEAGIVAVSAAALMDIATALDGKVMTLHFTEANKPFRVSAADRPNAVVMQAPIVGKT